MPELPEVETIRRELLPEVKGRAIKSTEIIDEKCVKGGMTTELGAKIQGKRITDIHRRGKYLIFKLSGPLDMVIHLKMAGALLVNPPPPVRFLRVLFNLSGGQIMAFTDKRRFGRVWLIRDEAEIDKKLGPEPLEPSFTFEVFQERLRGRKSPIKPLLLDQGFIAGVGNMYADEALFEASLNPNRPADKLKVSEQKKLHRAVINVLSKGLASKGASVDAYVRPGGITGTAHESFNVAHGRGKLCPRCGTAIKRIELRGRGTYFCPVCQRR